MNDFNENDGNTWNRIKYDGAIGVGFTIGFLVGTICTALALSVFF